MIPNLSKLEHSIQGFAHNHVMPLAIHFTGLRKYTEQFVEGKVSVYIMSVWPSPPRKDYKKQMFRFTGIFLFLKEAQNIF